MISSAQIIFPWLAHEPQDKWKVPPLGLLVECSSRTTGRRPSSLICRVGCLVSLLQHPVPATARLLTVLNGCDWIKTDFWKKKKILIRCTIQRYTDIYLRYAFFWVITRRILAVPYWRFGTTHRSHFLEFLTLEEGTDKLSINVGKELPLYPK